MAYTPEYKKLYARKYYLENKSKITANSRERRKLCLQARFAEDVDYKKNYTKEERKQIVVEKIRRLDMLGNKIEWLFIGNKSINYLYKLLKISR